MTSRRIKKKVQQSRGYTKNSISSSVAFAVSDFTGFYVPGQDHHDLECEEQSLEFKYSLMSITLLGGGGGGF